MYHLKNSTTPMSVAAGDEDGFFFLGAARESAFFDRHLKATKIAPSRY